MAERRKVIAVQFGCGNEELWKRYGRIEVKNFDTVKEGVPVPFGLSDIRMGPSRKLDVCKTCGERMAKCPGHGGYYILPKACFHPGMIKAAQLVLRSVCHRCSKLLMPKEEILTKHYSWIEKKCTGSKKYSVCGGYVKKSS